MVHLNNPPVPKNKNMMVLVAVLIFGLAALVAFLLEESVEKPKENSEIQEKIVQLEKKIALKQQEEKREAMDDAEAANQFDPEVNDSSAETQAASSKFMEQETNLQEGTTSEYNYLQERIWGFWHIILPLFVVIGIFLYWVKKKHKKWMR